jgi:glucokinase
MQFDKSSNTKDLFFGIEIGGTKLQLGVGRGDGTPPLAFERLDVQPSQGAAGIRRQIETAARPLVEKHAVRAVGIGFGGPVDAEAGRTIKSHQVEGWDDFPLVDWCRRTLGLPARLANDADAAGLAEARFGAGRNHRVVFYLTVGSGIGGALVIDGEVYRGGQGIAAELGHLRPGLDCDRPHETVEAISSGFGLAATARAVLHHRPGDPKTTTPLSPCGRGAGGEGMPPPNQGVIPGQILRELCGGHPDRVTGRMVVQAAADGDPLAGEIFQRALQTLGWAIAQAVTLVAPQVVVIGGGVPQSGESLFFAPLRREVARYVFPPLAHSYRILAAELGEEVVVHGALAIAAEAPAGP